MSWTKRRRFWIIAAFVVVVVGLFALAVFQTVKAEQNAVHGKAALAKAEQDINAQNVRARAGRSARAALRDDELCAAMSGSADLQGPEDLRKRSPRV